MKKITLKRTTVRNLSDSDLGGAAGAGTEPPKVLTQGCTTTLSQVDRCESALQCETVRCPVSLTCHTVICPTIPR
jgi:hypothetical protein